MPDTAQATSAPASASAEGGRDLSAAIAACFSPETTTPAFPDRLVELIVALTNQHNAAIWATQTKDEPPVIVAQDRHAKEGETEQAIAQEMLADQQDAQQAVMRVFEAYLAATIALPGGRISALLLEMPAGGAVVRSLAYERLTLMANLSFAQFRHGDLVAQSQMIKTISAIASGDRAQTQNLADTLAGLMGADYAAAGFHSGGGISDLAISGQSGMTKRAQLPAKLRGVMKEVAQKKVRTNDRYFAAAPGREEGLVLIVEKPTRNIGMVQLAGSVFGQAQQGKPPSRWTTAKLVRAAAILLAVIGIGFIPINDGVEVPATVEAAKKRVVTAPLSAAIAEVLVADKQQVIGGETVLLRLDTQEIDLDLIGVMAERANAVLERETARASRNAALLRNAELEVDRLDARIALLELNRDSGEIVAPISGIVLLESLEQRAGATVRQGERLLEVSDPSALRLSLAIVESQASKVSEADAGVFRPDFDPTLRLAANVSNISPAVDNSEDIPTILGKAEFEDSPEALRPGLRGVFAVSQEWRPIWQVLYRNVRNWVLLRVWL